MSVTCLPAYPDTSLSLRSAPKEIRSKILETRNVGLGTTDDCGDDVNAARDWKANMEIRLKLHALRM
jgi:hypothetical protein